MTKLGGTGYESIKGSATLPPPIRSIVSKAIVPKIKYLGGSKMNGTGLTVANVTTLASKELTVELFNIMNAINEGNKSAWEVARAYKRIIDDELFDEDFENVQEFALYVGVSKSTISQYIKAVEFVEKHEFGFDMFTVGSAYLLSTLTDEEFIDFVKWAEEQEIDLTTMSVKALRNLIKEYDSKDNVEEDIIEDSTDNDDSNESDEEITISAREAVISRIKELMEDYNITVEDILEAQGITTEDRA